MFFLTWPELVVLHLKHDKFTNTNDRYLQTTWPESIFLHSSQVSFWSVCPKYLIVLVIFVSTIFTCHIHNLKDGNIIIGLNWIKYKDTKRIIKISLEVTYQKHMSIAFAYHLYDMRRYIMYLIIHLKIKI